MSFINELKQTTENAKKFQRLKDEKLEKLLKSDPYLSIRDAFLILWADSGKVKDEGVTAHFYFGGHSFWIKIEKWHTKEMPARITHGLVNRCCANRLNEDILHIPAQGFEALAICLNEMINKMLAKGVRG